MTPKIRLIAINLSVLVFASPLSADLQFTATGQIIGGTYGSTVISADGSVVVGSANGSTTASIPIGGGSAFLRLVVTRNP